MTFPQVPKPTRRKASRPSVLWVYKVFDVGGAEQLLLELLPYLSQSIDVIPVAVSGNSREMMLRYQAAGLGPIDLCSTGRFDVSWPLRLRTLVRRLHPEAVHFHSPLAAALGRPALVGLDVPIVYTEHNIWPNYFWATRALNIATYPLNDAAYAVSDAVRASQRQSTFGWVARRTRTLRNGINIEQVVADARETHAQIAHPSYGAIGHLRMLKGVDVLLRAAVRLDRNGVESTGYVIGNGEDARELDQLRRTLGVSDSVIFTGYRPDARSILGELDVFVIPSRHEGLPVALLEAMALEKPIVSTMVGGIPEVLEHERSALLVPPDDPDAMADAIARLLTDTELAMCLGREAGCVARDRFGARIAADRLLEGYGELLGSGFPLMTSS